MTFNATARKSRSQWAKELKGTEHKTFTHPRGCKHGHEKLFSVSEGGKCVECVRLKDIKRHARTRHGMTVEEYLQKKENEKRQRDEAEYQRKVEAEQRKVEAEFQRFIEKADAAAEPEVGHVYALSCSATGRTYIGSTRRLKARVAQHRHLIKTGKHHVAELLADLEEHGQETLRFDVLCTIHSGDREEVEALERFYLDTWKGPLLNKFKPTSTLQA